MNHVYANSTIHQNHQFCIWITNIISNQPTLKYNINKQSNTFKYREQSASVINISIGFPPASRTHQWTFFTSGGDQKQALKHWTYLTPKLSSFPLLINSKNDSDVLSAFAFQSEVQLENALKGLPLSVALLSIRICYRHYSQPSVYHSPQIKRGRRHSRWKTT